MERFPSVSDDVGLEEDQSTADIHSQITSSDETSAFVSDFDSSTGRPDDSAASSSSSTKGTVRPNNVSFAADLDDELTSDETMTMTDATAAASVGGSEEDNILDPVVLTTENTYTSVEIGDVNEERSERSTLSHSSSVETLLSVKSLSPKHRPPLRKGVSQDLNGNPEYDGVSAAEPGSRESASPSPVPVVVVVVEDVPPGIGFFCDGEVPLVYCARLLCRRFLLAGTSQNLISDKTVRVSMKTLALGSIASAINIYPRLCLYNMFVDRYQSKCLLTSIITSFQFVSRNFY